MTCGFLILRDDLKRNFYQMKKPKIIFIFMSSLVGIASLTSKAIASDEGSNCLYLTGNIGISSIQNTDWEETLSGTAYKGQISTEPGIRSEVGIGCKAASNLRFELSHIQASGDVDSFTAKNHLTTSSGEIATKSILAGAYIDFPNGQSKFVPYLGVGIGSTNIAMDKLSVNGIETGDGDISTFSYQIKIGSSYELASQTDLYLEASFLGTPEFEINGSEIDSLRALNASFGARFHF